MRTIVVARTALFLLASITVMRAQQSQPQATPVATVPRLVRVSNTFHPAAGQPAVPVESVTFAIYREESGGAPLWQETQNVDVDAEGHYTALLGSTLNEGVSLELFSSAEPRWLGVRFNRPGEAEQPRVQLASVPYALKASDTETLGGRPASAYLLNPNATSGSAATATAGSFGAAASEIPAPGKLKPRTTSGTTNCIAVFTDSTDLGCSPMWQSGNNIGIGTHSPAAPLQVVGTANPSVLIDTYGNSTNFRQRRADGTPASPTGVRIGEIIGNTSFTGYGTTGFLAAGSAAIKGIAAENFTDSTGGGILTFSTITGGTTNLTERMRIDQNGNVGIGTQTPGFRLDVEGGTINGNNPAASGFAPGVAGTSASANGAGVSGFNQYTAGAMGSYPTGVQGGVNGPTGAGVAGNAQMAGAAGVSGSNSATTGPAPGVNGTSASANGAGVNGFNQYTAGAMDSFPTGVQGGVNGPTGAGVSGNAQMAGAVGVSAFNSATSGFAVGVVGGTASNNGFGVQGNASQAGAAGVSGRNSAISGYAVGVQGGTASNGGAGVQGNASQAGAAGVNGFNSATTGYAVGVSGGTASNGGAGVQGNAGSGAFGVSGFNGGTSGFGVGTQGASSSPQGIGVLAVDWNCGQSACTLVPGTAAQLETATTGVLLQGLSGAAGANNNTAKQVFAVDGAGDGTFAGNVNIGGNLVVTGSVTKGGGSFRIDHPLDPENKYLYHSFVESPDMKNIYDGVVLLDENGEATVALPDWFEALNQDFRYQLTCIGGYAPVYIGTEISGNQFRIAGGRAGLKVSWQVTGTRHDAYANAHRIPLEVEKPASER